ncbi:MAG: hypothetical protein RRZ84_05515 [Romboutsia sp.]|uniref:hypothetical protein n=1 Tax=Terrisporobacter sp. TaxID=1965305 RepID=UPI002FCA8876
MKINERIFNYIDILGDLETISKSLYLESPELWIDFSDKIADQNLDEMVLFYATKYNYVSILKFVCEHQIVNLEAPSKNKNFSSIIKHLIAVASEFNSLDVYNYLTKDKNTSNHVDTEEKVENKEVKEDKTINSKEIYYPNFNCPCCDSNIFKNGYKISDEIIYTFSPDNNKCEESSRLRNENIFCCTCNAFIDNISLDSLQKICSINNCTKCGEDLTKIGIDQKINMKLDLNTNRFVPSKDIFVCSSCQEPLNKLQIQHFSL